MCTGFVWIRTGASSRLLRTGELIFGSHERRRIPWLAEWQSPSYDGLFYGAIIVFNSAFACKPIRPNVCIFALLLISAVLSVFVHMCVIIKSYKSANHITDDRKIQMRPFCCSSKRSWRNIHTYSTARRHFYPIPCWYKLTLSCGQKYLHRPALDVRVTDEWWKALIRNRWSANHPIREIYLCEISRSHGGEYEDGCLLCCSAV
jgi:hypothetical protein